MAVSGDRRRRKRVALHWPVRVLREPGVPLVETATENLSSEGLYCISKQPFRTGDRLLCEIVLPREIFGCSEPSLRLQCHLRVRRVEHLDRGFGVGCHIEDYTLATGSPPLAT